MRPRLLYLFRLHDRVICLCCLDVFSDLSSELFEEFALVDILGLRRQSLPFVLRLVIDDTGASANQALASDVFEERVGCNKLAIHIDVTFLGAFETALENSLTVVVLLILDVHLQNELDDIFECQDANQFILVQFFVLVTAFLNF